MFHKGSPKCCGKMIVYERYYYPKTRCVRIFYECTNCKREIVVIKPKLNVRRLIDRKIDNIRNFKRKRLEKAEPLFSLALMTPENAGILL